LARRCGECHQNTAERNVSGLPFNWAIRREKERSLIRHPTGAHERLIIANDPARKYDAALLVNYTQPEFSSILLAPLAKSAGGYARCGKPVFGDKQDPDYQKILASIESGRALFLARPAWGSPGWKPNPQYLREMKRFGLLPEAFDPAAAPFDPFAMDQTYWRSLWPQPGS
jgi:hypothetical protein